MKNTSKGPRPGTWEWYVDMASVTQDRTMHGRRSGKDAELERAKAAAEAAGLRCVKVERVSR